MKWICFSIHTTVEAEDYVSAILYSLDVSNIEVVDNQPVFGLEVQGDYPELYPDLPEDDGSAEVKFYLEVKDGTENTALLNSGTEIQEADTCPWNESNFQKLLDEIQIRMMELKKVMDIGPANITRDETDEEDWENNWKNYFHGFSIGSLRIEPTWEENPKMDGAEKLLRIDPGLAFGTGAHETTHLVITQIQKYLKEGDQVLDVGCGSGILSIVSLLYGANFVTETDIDPLCKEAVSENFLNNKLDESLTKLYIGDLTSDKTLQDQIGHGCYDVVCANILADILIPMANQIADTMKKGAYVLTSGIINGREEDVAKALSDAGLTIVEKNRLGDWWNVTAQK